MHYILMIYNIFDYNSKIVDSIYVEQQTLITTTAK